MYGRRNIGIVVCHFSSEIVKTVEEFTRRLMIMARGNRKKIAQDIHLCLLKRSLDIENYGLLSETNRCAK